MKRQVNLYLDDERKPNPGWIHVKTVEEAKKILIDPTLRVVCWTLDHDLGEGQSGYDLLCWLEENPQYWPLKVPAVHSANPVGRQRMLVVIKRHYGSC